MWRTSAILLSIAGLLTVALVLVGSIGPAHSPTGLPVDVVRGLEGHRSAVTIEDAEPLSRMLEEGRSRRACGVILKDAATASPVAGVRVQWQDSVSAAAQAWHTAESNDLGQVCVDPGALRIRVVDRDWFAAPTDVTLVDGWVTVWVVAQPELTLCVQTPAGLPVAGASVDLVRFDASVRGLGRTDENGCLDLGRIEMDDRALLVVSHNLYWPATVQVTSLERRGERVVVCLKPCQKVVEIHAETGAGQPVGGVAVGVVHIEGGHAAIGLGETDGAGRLQVGADWIGTHHLWVVGGTAYAARVAVTEPGDNGFRIVVFPRVSGRVMLVRPTPEPIVWRCVDDAMDERGCGMMLQEVVQPRGRAIQNLELPAGRTVRLEGFVGGALRYEERVTAQDHGWQVLAEERGQTQRRMVHVRAQGARIVGITEGEADVHHPDLPGYAVQAAVSTEATTVKVLLENGERHMLVGQPGDADIVVDLPARQVAPVCLEAVDRGGQPLADAVFSLACRTQLERVAEGWQAMRIANMHRLRSDASGKVVGELPVGTYSLEVQPPAELDPLGVSWTPVAPKVVEVLADGLQTRVVADAGRRVVVALQARDRPPGVWRLVAGPWSAAFGGDHCQVWLPSSIGEVEVLDLSGQVLGTAAVDSEQTHVEVALLAEGR